MSGFADLVTHLLVWLTTLICLLFVSIIWHALTDGMLQPLLTYVRSYMLWFCSQGCFGLHVNLADLYSIFLYSDHYSKPRHIPVQWICCCYLFLIETLEGKCRYRFVFIVTMQQDCHLVHHFHLLCNVWKIHLHNQSLSMCDDIAYSH